MKYHRGKSKVNVLQVATHRNIISNTLKCLSKRTKTEKSGGSQCSTHTRMLFKLKRQHNPTITLNLLCKGDRLTWSLMRRDLVPQHTHII